MNWESPEQEYSQASNSALRLLGRRDHSEFELREKLKKRNYSAETIDKVVADCYRFAYLDDNRFAEMFITSRANQGRGPKRISYELRQKGVTETIIDQAMASCSEDWNAVATAVCRRKTGSSPLLDYKEKARVYRYLTNRGFGREHIAYALKNNALNDNAQSDEDFI